MRLMLTWLALASQIIVPVLPAAAVEPELTIKTSGWQFPGLDHAYKAHEPRTRGKLVDGIPYYFDTERSRVFIEESPPDLGDYTPVLVETALREGNAVRIEEELVVVRSWISYSESGSKPYCFRLFTTLYRRNQDVDAKTYAIYDQDGDGTFEGLERVETLSSTPALKWRPRPRHRTTPSTSRLEPRVLASINDTGWRVPGWSDIGSAQTRRTWEVRTADWVVKADSFQPTTHDSAWLVTAMETDRGLQVMRDSIVAREVVRYRLNDGPVFCVWVRAGPWTWEGMQAAEWGWAYYDMDGDGNFELLVSAGEVGGSKQREWVPRLPEKK